MIRKQLYVALIFSIIFSACAPLGGTFEVGVITESPETSSLPSPTLNPPSRTPNQSTPTPAQLTGTGTVMGKICFPSENIPPMTVYFQNQATGVVEQLLIAENQLSYTQELESGDYIAFAYPEIMRVTDVADRM